MKTILKFDINKKINNVEEFPNYVNIFLILPSAKLILPSGLLVLCAVYLKYTSSTLR